MDRSTQPPSLRATSLHQAPQQHYRTTTALRMLFTVLVALTILLTTSALPVQQRSPQLGETPLERDLSDFHIPFGDADPFAVAGHEPLPDLSQPCIPVPQYDDVQGHLGWAAPVRRQAVPDFNSDGPVHVPDFPEETDQHPLDEPLVPVPLFGGVK